MGVEVATIDAVALGEGLTTSVEGEVDVEVELIVVGGTAVDSIVAVVVGAALGPTRRRAAHPTLQAAAPSTMMTAMMIKM